MLTLREYMSSPSGFFGAVRVAHRPSFLCCPISIKTMFGSSLVVCRRAYILFIIFVFACG
jgi:hypothetical protein